MTERLPNRGYLVAAVLSIIACALQVVGLVRYVNRLPGDTVGIILYSVTVVALAVAGVGFWMRYKAGKR